MYCQKCGAFVASSDKFCESCGSPVGEAANEAESAQNNYTSNYSNQNNSNDSKINIKDYLTIENLERFAPLVVFAPLALSILTGILGATIGLIPFVGTIVVFLIKMILILASLGGFVGLSYIAATKRKVDSVWTWIAPVATFCAFIACLGVFFNWGPVGFILGLIAFVIGLDLLPRIVICNQPIDTPVNIGADVNIYKQFYANYRAKYPTTKELEKAGIVDPENSYFDGSGVELFGYLILTSILCSVTCGLATPWMVCKIYRWRLSHKVINGKKLTFNGSGASLLGHWILWEILTIITCGIYSFFTYVALKKWELSHTFIDGEPITPNDATSFFDGNSFEYMGYSILGGILTMITCGLATPWVSCMLTNWEIKHSVVNQRRLKFSGTGLGFLGEFLIILILTIITCGIYTPWGIVRFEKYVTRNTDFE